MTLPDLVKRLQLAMNKLGSKLDADGVFGPLTAKELDYYELRMALKEKAKAPVAALELALKIIREFEGCELKAYRDTGGVLTIGWGDTNGVYEGQVITQEEADKRLNDLVLELMTKVEYLVTVPVSDSALAALTSFAYNVGIGNLSGSTLLKLLNDGAKPEVVAEQFGLWVHDSQGVIQPGLVRRRAEEKALFLS